MLWELGGRGTVGGYLGSYTVVREDHKGICMGYQSVTGDMGVIGGFIVAIGCYGAIGKCGGTIDGL